MELCVSKLQEYERNKLSDTVEFQKDTARQNFGSGCVKNVSKYFSGSTLTFDMFSSQTIFSYHRDDLKSLSFSNYEKQTLVTEVLRQQSSSSENIDWSRISIPNRSGIQCLMQFRNDCDPDISCAKWSPTEEERLLAAADAGKERDWCRIADSVSAGDSGKRTPLQCLRHYQLNFNKALLRPTEWSNDEEQLLLDAAALYGTNKTWQHISNCLEGRAASQCFVRWKRIKARGMKSGSWSEAEERKLVFGVVAHERKRRRGDEAEAEDRGAAATGGKRAVGGGGCTVAGNSVWQKISECVPRRDEVRCREKWTNVLDPACADTAPFTVHEDAVIMHEARQHSASGGGGGAVRWASVASKLVGRTDAQCLRRWRELCGPVAAKVYAEKAKKRRAIAVPRHSRAKASKSSLDDRDFTPVLLT